MGERKGERNFAWLEAKVAFGILGSQTQRPQYYQSYLVTYSVETATVVIAHSNIENIKHTECLSLLRRWNGLEHRLVYIEQWKKRLKSDLRTRDVKYNLERRIRRLLGSH